MSWAEHHATGQKPSRDLIAAALVSKDEFEAIELQSQILYALADQVGEGECPSMIYFHLFLLECLVQYAFGPDITTGLDLSTYDPSRDDEDTGRRSASASLELTIYNRLLKGTGDMHEQYSSITIPKSLTSSDTAFSTVNLLSHIHLVNLGGVSACQRYHHTSPTASHLYIRNMAYSELLMVPCVWTGTYYSYMFARMHAAQIWHCQFKNNPLNRSEITRPMSICDADTHMIHLLLMLN